MEIIVTHWAYAAASATAGQIAGSPAVYTRYMQQLLPVIQQPYEAVLMLRLLHDEGIVGECSHQAGAGLATDHEGVCHQHVLFAAYRLYLACLDHLNRHQIKLLQHSRQQLVPC
jgi:hypothetical protein